MNKLYLFPGIVALLCPVCTCHGRRVDKSAESVQRWHHVNSGRRAKSLHALPKFESLNDMKLQSWVGGGRAVGTQLKAFVGLLDSLKNAAAFQLPARGVIESRDNQRGSVSMMSSGDGPTGTQVRRLKSAPEILFGGMDNLRKKRAGWDYLFGQEADTSSSVVNENASEAVVDGGVSSQDKVFDVAKVVEMLKADAPRILQEDPRWEIFAEDFKVIDQKGTIVQGLGPSQRLLTLLRRLSKFVENTDIEVQFTTAGNNVNMTSWKARWTAQLGRMQLPFWDRDVPVEIRDVPVDVEVDTTFQLNKDNKLEAVQIDKWFVNGQDFKFWPEEAIEILQADIPEILTREPTWAYYSKDIKLIDQTGLSGNAIVFGQENNKRLLQLLRNFHNVLGTLVLKDDFRVKTRKTLVATPDGTIEPALIAGWSFEVDSSLDIPNIPILENLKDLNIPLIPANAGLPLKLAGTATYRFNQQDKVQCMKIDSLTINDEELKLPSLNLNF